MNVSNVLIIDVETTGLDPENSRIIEVGYVLWSAQWRTMRESYSSLLFATQDDNDNDDSPDSELVNGVPRDMVDSISEVGDPSMVWAIVADAAKRADFVVAHFAEFDRKFVAAFEQTSRRDWSISTEMSTILGKPWVCTIEDFEWPVPCKARNLTELALCHGVGVVAAHRSVNDCLTLARMFERVPDIEERLASALQRSLRPRAMFASLEPFEMKDVVKAAGFKWVPPLFVEGKQVWHRHMAIEDAEKLSFEVMQVDS